MESEIWHTFFESEYWMCVSENDLCSLISSCKSIYDVASTSIRDLIRWRKCKQLPLPSATREGDLKLIKYLLIHGYSMSNNTLNNADKPFQKDDVEFIKQFINLAWKYQGFKMDFSLPYVSVLSGAAQFGATKIVEELISMGADTHRCWTPINNACKYGHLNTFKSLIALGANSERSPAGGLICLNYAVLSGNDRLIHFLTNVVDVDKPLVFGNWNALKYAVKYNLMRNIWEILQEFGSNIDEYKWGVTALLKYIYSATITTLLLKMGANVNLPSLSLPYNTPLQLAVVQCKPDTIKVLIQYGANVNRENSNNLTALHLACEKRRWDIMEILIKRGANVNTITNEQMEPLHISCLQPVPESVQFLLSSGIKPSPVNEIKHGSSLHISINSPFVHYNRDPTIKCILSHLPESVNAVDQNGNTALHLAILKKHTSVIKILLQQGADITAINIKGFTPIQLSKEREIVASVMINLGIPTSEGASIDFVRSIQNKKLIPRNWTSPFSLSHVPLSARVKLNLDVITNQQDKYPFLEKIITINTGFCILLEEFVWKRKYSPLFYFISSANWNYIQDQIKITAFLDSLGASVDNIACPIFHSEEREDWVQILSPAYKIAWREKYEFLFHAVMAGNKEKVEEIVRNGSPVDLVSPSVRWNSLQIAVYTGQIDMFLLLVKLGADILCLASRIGNSLLHLAALMGHWWIVRTLVDLGWANPNVTNKTGDTPLHLAVWLQKMDVITVLLQVRAHPSTQNKEGASPLHFAACVGNECIVEVLLSFGADCNVKDLNGDTPLHFAVRADNVKAAIAMVKRGASIKITNKHKISPKQLIQKNVSMLQEFSALKLLR